MERHSAPATPKAESPIAAREVSRSPRRAGGVWRDFGRVWEFDPRLGHDPPPARPFIVVVERATKVTTKEADGPRMTKPRSGLN